MLTGPAYLPFIDSMIAVVYLQEQWSLCLLHHLTSLEISCTNAVWMWKKQARAVFQLVGNEHSFHRQAKEGSISLSLKTHPLRKWAVCCCLVKMPVQVDSLKNVLLAVLVAVLAGSFLSFYPLLAYEAKVYLIRLFVFCRPFFGRVGRRMKQKQLGF